MSTGAAIVVTSPCAERALSYEKKPYTHRLMVGENLGYTCEELNAIYDKNDGYCWHCGKKLAFTNYGKIGNKGAWEVDHSNPVSKGGTDYLRNLVPSCIDCNRSKGIRRRLG